MLPYSPVTAVISHASPKKSRAARNRREARIEAEAEAERKAAADKELDQFALFGSDHSTV